jgi:hypothetical protein
MTLRRCAASGFALVFLGLSRPLFQILEDYEPPVTALRALIRYNGRFVPYPIREETTQ